MAGDRQLTTRLRCIVTCATETGELDRESISEIIRHAAPYIRHVHLNDPNRLGPGMGEVDFGPILRALRGVGYQGWLSVKPFDFSPGPERIARESWAYLKRCVESRDFLVHWW